MSEQPTECERFMIRDNLERRHLDRFALARLYVELKRLDRGVGRTRNASSSDLRDRIGQRLGFRGRTLERIAFV